MNRNSLLVLLIAVIIGCKSTANTDIPKDWHQLDLGKFKISVPADWSYEDPGKQEDSFVGHITAPQFYLIFDCSDMGYASHLISKQDDPQGSYIVTSDTSINYITNTIRPKTQGRGITGIYIHSRKSSFNFQMNAQGLSAKDEADALKAFKTITFKP